IYTNDEKILKFLMNKTLLFIQLNEINFDLVNKYVDGSKKKFLNLRYIRKNYKKFSTFAEVEYKNQEPWIQWASVHLGKNFKDHGIFRLGDIVNHLDQKQIFETIESKGYKVGAISPMNAENRLKNPAYFIPDPWTDTKSDISGFSKRLSSLLKQSVNDNSSGKLSFGSLITIFEIIFKTLHYRNTLILIRLIFSSIIKPWKKSLVLDYLIHMVHIHLYKKKNPSFSSIFLNAGAHIQHHYFYNTKYINNLPKNPNWYVNSFSDPIEDMLEVYDKIIGDYIKLSKNEHCLLIATGLRQVPYDLIKFYYRLKNHKIFLNMIGIKFLKVLPRMTRDFEIIFETENDSIVAKDILENIVSKKDNIKIFGEIEEREKSLFITLTYPHEIKKKDFVIINNNSELNFFNEVSFVAIKNGKHDQKGYAFYSPNLDLKTPKDPIHVSKIFNMISNIF
ncbi:hypothetical protein N9J04_03100, partial [Candidatus Pelagibacter sp.]|nr:hypothetical protein [Candidatus Pelagibacter sp.]